MAPSNTCRAPAIVCVAPACCAAAGKHAGNNRTAASEIDGRVEFLLQG
jgi:hypothetical protein